MAVSVSRAVPPFVPGAGRISVSDVTLDSSYVTGGLPLTPAQLGLNQVDAAACAVKAASTSAVANAAYDVVNQKVKALTTTAEVAATTDCSAVVVTVVAFGR